MDPRTYGGVDGGCTDRCDGKPDGTLRLLKSLLGWLSGPENHQCELPAQAEQNLLERNLFRDTLRVSRFLGVPFSWIDSLWIGQKDSEDWDSQGNKTADIYQGASFTIAVQFDDENGFMLQPTVHEIRPATAIEAAVYARQLESPTFLSQTGVFIEREGHNPPWLNARGWCYQERSCPRESFISHATKSCSKIAKPYGANVETISPCLRGSLGIRRPH